MHLAVNHFRGSSRKPTSAELAEVQRLKWFIAAKDEQERKEKQEERAEKTDKGGDTGRVMRLKSRDFR